MPAPKDEEIKIRVPGAMKHAVQTIAARRMTSESEIAREALIEYLESRVPKLVSELRETPPPYKVNSTQKAKTDEKVGKIVRAHFPPSKPK